MRFDVKVGDAFICIKNSKFLYRNTLIITAVHENVVEYRYNNIDLPYDKSIEYFTDEFLEPVSSLIKELL